MSAPTQTHTSAPAPAAGGNRGRAGARLIDLVWLTWRQHRPVITGGLALAAALTGSMLLVAARITTISHECGTAPCPAGSAQAASLAGTFGLSSVSGYLAIAVMFLPLLTGVFLGVPLLAREHEQRTLLLAWSQDIGPQRWVWTKFALLGGLAAAASAAVSAAAGHMASVASAATGHSLFSGSAFLVTGMVPLAQSVAWLALGVALGAAYRRTLPAIFTALAGYVAAYFVVQWVYPTFMTPLTALVPIAGDQPVFTSLASNSLIIPSSQITDAAGRPVSQAVIQSLCPATGNGARFASDQCLAQHHFLSMLSYQPASRIPDFHLILIAGYLGLGAVALAAVWWLVRRTSLSAG
jgi:hypothetical protein